MYETFYGLKDNPFRITPDPQFFYFGAKHREALAHILYGIKERKGIIVITGEVGTGKTTLIHYILRKFDPSHKMRTAFLLNPKLTPNDFIIQILNELGVEERPESKGEALYRLHKELIKAYEQGERVVLFIDEAQGLSPELLEETRLLSNLEASKSKLIQIVLIGQPEFDETLNQSNFRHLRQRINLRYQLQALSEAETYEYIQKRLMIAGARAPIFTEKAIREIYRYSGGIPRLINILADNALLDGFSSGYRMVEPDLIRNAAQSLQLKAHANGRGWIRALALSGGVAGLMLLSYWFYEWNYWEPLWAHLQKVLRAFWGSALAKMFPAS